MSDEGKVRVVNGREIRDRFRELNTEDGKAGSKALKGAYKETADQAAGWARSAARSGTPLQQRMAGAIKGAATERGGRLNISNAGRNRPAWAAFWGQKKRSGWFGASQYDEYDGQDQGLPEWVGAAWSTGVPGEGPHAVNDALAEHRKDIEQIHLDAIQRAAAEVGLT